jgi:hypothetical protein
MDSLNTLGEETKNMRPAYAIYVLESQWTWDHFNTELATFTVEGREGHRWQTEFECLVDATCPEEQKDMILRRLERVAEEQNNCQMDSTPHLICLYRVVDYDGILRVSPREGETPKLNLTLELICKFDENNKPIMPGKGEMGTRTEDGHIYRESPEDVWTNKKSGVAVAKFTSSYFQIRVPGRDSQDVAGTDAEERAFLSAGLFIKQRTS